MERKAREFIVAFILSASDPHAFVPLVFRLPTISLCTKQSRFVDHLSFWLSVNCLFTFLAARMFAMCRLSSLSDSRWF